MKKRLTKKQVMKHYFSDEELKDMMNLPVKTTLKWLEGARRFFNKVTPTATKKLQERLILEGW